MRFLKVQDDGNVSLTEDLTYDTPPYAILSHTWESDTQEVRFNDIGRQAAQTKDGYRKIDFCQKQTTKDGLQHFWVDTCCINQDSDVELTRSINSMFRWYRDATKCYVYLSDVNASTWEGAFRQSRWFTRGWTLQELIAPRAVDFFSSEGQFLGDRTSLEQQLHAITKIPVAALRGATLSEFSIEERMSWSEHRETKLPEDKAYCLLGIFDIHMPLIYGEGQEHACRRLRKELDSYQRQRRPAPFSNVPFSRDPSFVDRPEILAWIRQKCDRPAARVALVGIGGIGCVYDMFCRVTSLTTDRKSQVIIEYAYRKRQHRPETWVFWVHANTAARAEEAYRSIADKLDLPGRYNPNVNIYQLVSNWLCDEANGQWILILDNADDIEVIFPDQKSQGASTPLGHYLPQSHNGSILVTSRNKDAALRIVGDISNVMQVQAMAKDQALQLLRNKLHTLSGEDGIADLIHALDYVPLAITQATAYINRRSRMTVPSYLDEFHRSSRRKKTLLDQDLGDLRRDSSASNSVDTTWRLSFESVREERPSAADLLSLMSFFQPHGIPDWVLRKYKNTNSSTDGDIADGDFDNDIDLLEALSLIIIAADNETYGIHTLIQFCTRAWLSSLHDEEVWRQRFLTLMAKEFPTGELQNRAKCRQLMPHLESLYNQEPPGEEAVKVWAQLLTNAAWYMWHEGNYSAAQGVAEKSLKVKERLLKYDESTLASMAILASILRGQGKYKEAEELNRRGLAESEMMLGKQHPDTLTSMSNLGLILRDLGKYEEAEKVQRKVLEERENKLGTLHPETLLSMSNLALLLRDQGIYDEAEIMNRRALEGREKVLGKRHPSTMASASNLALILQEQGQYDESEMLNRHALEGREAELGKQHPHTLTSMNNLALVLQDQGKHGEAEMMNRRVLDAYKKQFGMQHPNTLTSVSNLAFVLQEQGQYDEAERLNRRALGGREAILGKQHPDSLTSLSNLAFILRLQERYSDSEALNRQALKGREVQLGSQHPDTLASVNNLALALRDQQKYAEAEDLSRRALQGYRTELGAHHPYTLTSLSNLASILQDQGNRSEAEAIYRHVLEAYEKALGMQHPDTLRSVSNLASVLQGQGKYAEAEELNRRALEGREEQLGIQHPDTVKSAGDLSSVLQDQRKCEEMGEMG